METIILIGGVASALTSVVALLALIVKPFRNALLKRFTYRTAEHDAQLATLRHAITLLYFKYLDRQELPMYIKENLTYLYNAYKGLGGNSYIEEIYQEMMTWKVVR